MSRYFLQVRGGSREFIDTEGSEIDTLEALRDTVLRSARELMIDGIQRGVLDLRYKIDAEDSRGKVVYSLPFTHAVNIITGTGDNLE